MTQRTHAFVEDGKKYIWKVESLWELSSILTPFDYAIADYEGLNEDHWYCGVNIPTIASILEHIQRIETSDLTYPIILSQEGEVMDGLHRICKAKLRGQDTIHAVQFPQTPKPDYIEPHPEKS
jgi:hypothetical protein